MRDKPAGSETDDAEKSKDDQRFRSVVKRLLDTPPMHKAGAAKPKRASSTLRKPIKDRRNPDE